MMLEHLRSKAQALKREIHALYLAARDPQKSELNISNVLGDGKKHAGAGQPERYGV